MKNHVTNLELSKKLKEAGFEQESEFYWTPKELIFCNLRQLMEIHKNTVVSAYLATELLKLIPDKYRKDIICYFSEDSYFCDQWDNEDGDTIWHELWEDNYSPQSFKADTLQDALGEMLLYLKKEGLI